MTSISPSLLAFGRSANDTPPKHLGTRYATDGRFLLEPGNTVVSHITAGSPSEAAVLAVRDRLMAMPEAAQFAFTHPSSLHMTIFQGIIEYRRRLPYWPADMALDSSIDEMTEHYRKRLKDFAPLEPFRARVTAITPTGLALEGDSAADRSCLKAWRDAFADVFGYRHPDHDHYEFHITFAYVIDWLADAALPRWQEMLDEQLAFLRERAPVIELDPPAFCAFKDMNHFEELIVFSNAAEIKDNR
ncbi:MULTISPECIES: DUF1868 domain-containing protein [unclassified Ensifer]|uniref:DUF1868 domain-containing protein n=1 Tax=unclassified Ensifer TaxID=2633371 RepID=UPI000812CC56|nr:MULTISPECIES: DUF1868 domain-containing protein [unclassified Ensifer]OCO99676.1 hypothetical protein BC362_25760 [Ensifer sp. LC14]OCP04777.1 hypothetical protein BBX50_24610 [Ensifer sp. LC11]OCP12543.1 hypothetical protein BC374_15010 [Ensifer sp. LC13]OCP32935.1 hypothetical protein BC364_18765 [Ensifer sp. LC499]